MVLLWVTLLLLHQGRASVPVVIVHVDEETTLTCALPDKRDTSVPLFWYRQTAGETLVVVVKIVNHATTEYGTGYSDSSVKGVLTDKMSNLTIFKTAQEDEGMYHCAFHDWKTSVWKGTYLLIKENTVGTTNYKISQWVTKLDSLRPNGSVTLQCSVLLEFKNMTSHYEDVSLFWFRSEKSYADIIYTDGNRPDKCQRKIDVQNGCIYNFSINISSSDMGTYYCAVATCGQMLFGTGNKLNVKDQKAESNFTVLVMAVPCLIISLIINAVFICHRSPRATCKRINAISSTNQQHHNSLIINSTQQSSKRDSPSSKERGRNLTQQDDRTNEDGLDLNYAALHFSAKKAARGKKMKETTDSVYSQFKP